MGNEGLVILRTVVLLVIFFPASGQRIMKLADDLKANSKPMEASRKGMSSKYQFGDYKIVSSKSGFRTSTKFELLGNKEEASEASSLFVFVSSENDTAWAKTFTNIDIKKWSSEKFTSPFMKNLSFIKEHKTNYFDLFLSNLDTTMWRMEVRVEKGTTTDTDFQWVGSLTDGTTEIQIKEVHLLENGKRTPFNIPIGYEFILQNKSLAAVQGLVSFQKKLVWVREDLDRNTKLMIAAAAASILVHVDDSAGH